MEVWKDSPEHSSVIERSGLRRHDWVIATPMLGISIRANIVMLFLLTVLLAAVKLA